MESNCEMMSIIDTARASFGLNFRYVEFRQKLSRFHPVSDVDGDHFDISTNSGMNRGGFKRLDLSGLFRRAPDVIRSGFKTVTRKVSDKGAPAEFLVEG